LDSCIIGEIILLKPNLHNKIYEIITKIAPRLLLGLISGMLAAGLPGNHVTPFNVYEETLKVFGDTINSS